MPSLISWICADQKKNPNFLLGSFALSSRLYTFNHLHWDLGYENHLGIPVYKPDNLCPAFLRGACHFRLQCPPFPVGSFLQFCSGGASSSRKSPDLILSRALQSSCGSALHAPSTVSAAQIRPFLVSRLTLLSGSPLPPGEVQSVACDLQPSCGEPQPFLLGLCCPVWKPPVPCGYLNLKCEN